MTTNEQIDNQKKDQLCNPLWTDRGSNKAFAWLTDIFSQWRNLNKEDKEKYEERAKRIAEEQLAKQQEATKAMNESLQGQWDSSGGKGSPAPPNRPGTPGGKYRCTVKYDSYC